MIAYLPEEEKDAQEAKKLVEKYGGKCYTFAGDLKDKNTCHKLVEEAINKLGEINILFNNHAYQMMVHDIQDLTEEQWELTFATNIHRTFFNFSLSI